MKLSEIRKPYLIIIVLVIIGGGYYWYKKTHPSATQVQYVTAPAQIGTLTTSVSASGNVIVDQSATVDPTITGTVADLAVNVGDKVTKGQFLFNIVNDQLGVSVAQAQSSYQSSLSSIESAEASLKQAKADYDSTKKDSSSTKKEKEAAKEKVDAAEASLESAQKSSVSSLVSLNYQYSQAAKRKVVAQISGTVNAVNIKNGDDLSKLSSGSSRQVPIIIGDLGTLKAQVQVNEVDTPNLNIGQKATMTFTAIDNLTITGKVEKMDSLGTLSQGVVTYNVTIGFDTLDSRIKPEMSVSASIITAVKQDVLLVPVSAVKIQNGSNYVEVLVNGSPVQKPVQVGDSNNTQTEITSGLSAGDEVVAQTISSGTSSATSTPSSTSRNTGGGGLRLPGLGGGGRFGD